MFGTALIAWSLTDRLRASRAVWRFRAEERYEMLKNMADVNATLRAELATMGKPMQTEVEYVDPTTVKQDPRMKP